MASFTNARPSKFDIRYAVGLVAEPSHGPTPTVVHVVLSLQFVMMPAQILLVLEVTHPHSAELDDDEPPGDADDAGHVEVPEDPQHLDARALTVFLTSADLLPQLNALEKSLPNSGCWLSAPVKTLMAWSHDIAELEPLAAEYSAVGV